VSAVRLSGKRATNALGMKGSLGFVGWNPPPTPGKSLAVPGKFKEAV
jgi:hypothetical protein